MPDGVSSRQACHKIWLDKPGSVFKRNEVGVNNGVNGWVIYLWPQASSMEESSEPLVFPATYQNVHETSSVVLMVKIPSLIEHHLCSTSMVTFLSVRMSPLHTSSMWPIRSIRAPQQLARWPNPVIHFPHHGISLQLRSRVRSSSRRPAHGSRAP